MAVVTGVLKWRSTTPAVDRTLRRMLEKMRDFITTQGGWTLVDDQTAAGANAYFVVSFNRNTGFSGDNPVVQVRLDSEGSFYAVPWESWDAASHTGTNAAAYANQGVSYAEGSTLRYDTDWYVSVDTTGKFILFSQTMWWGANAQPTTWYGPPNGVCCLERLPGDNDPGTFYGVINGTAVNAGTLRVYVPKLWDGSTGVNAYFSLNTVLGSNRTLYYLDERNEHAIFNFLAHRYQLGKLKGQVYGVAATTYHLHLLTQNMWLPSAASPRWLAHKHYQDYKYHVLMAASAPTVL